MRAVYRQLNPFQFNAVEFNPREVYRLLLGDEPPKPVGSEAPPTPQETLAELQQRYLPALQRLSEARLAGTPAEPADEAAIREFQRRAVSAIASDAPTPKQHVEITLPPEVFDLGESWRAIHMLLTGKRDEQRHEPERESVFGDSIFGKLEQFLPRGAIAPKANFFSMAIFGGAEVPVADSRLDHGPARLLTPEQVHSVASALDKMEPESLLAGYDSLAAAGVPAPDRTELARQYSRLRHFYVEAAANGNAVVTCLC